MGNAETGKKYAFAIGIYIILKQVINLILGDGFLSLILPIVLAILLFVGVKYSNYVVGVIMLIIFITNISTNIANIGFNRYLIYLAEGIFDILCAVVLFINKDVKEYFNATT